MVYFLGRDVHASITTEHSVLGIAVVVEGEAYLNNVLLAQVASINAGTDIITCAAVHSLSDGEPFTVTMDADATIGMGLTAGTIYYANAPSTTTLSVHTTRALGLSGASKVSLTDSEATTTNITREIVGTSDSSAPNTFIFNRNWPQYDGVGRIDTIIGDSTTPAPLQYSSATDRNRISDLTGLDLTFGKIDEDISYLGQRTALKAEVKNEVTVTFTRKTSDSRFEILFNKARDGVVSYTNTDKTAIDIDSASVISSTIPAVGTVELNHGGQNAATSASGIGQVPNQNFGYRIHIQLKSGATGEILTLQNMCMTDYSVSINVDGVTEETITFYGYVEPKIDANTTGYVTVTTTGEL